MINNVRNQLEEQYPHWAQYNEDIKPILNAVITGERFGGPMSECCGHKIEEYAKYSLLQLNEKTKRLDRPFIWLWLVSESHRDSLNLLWVEGVYTQAEYLENLEACLLGLACWQHWEVFTA